MKNKHSHETKMGSLVSYRPWSIQMQAICPSVNNALEMTSLFSGILGQMISNFLLC